MELIHGIPITKYCDDNHLTPRERLELFVPVYQAVQHAHQKGIIHRDIKPSNVLVTLYDGKPIPKVIDFGVAKAIDQKLTDNTLFTNFGTMVGTLEYMSPEQAEMNNLGVDTRSDIYSLGVLLYELLTGSTPLTRKRIKEAANLEILRLIKEEEPQKPSTRLSESGDALASISAHRHMEPAKLTRLVRGELDWIVMKTLEKDRNRRYETANGLAVELQRYLADEPVQACPPSKWYRIKKFVRRNKGAVIAGIAMLSLTILGTVCTSIGMVWALRAEQAATTERDLAKIAKKEAVEEAAIAQAVNDFLRNDLLAEAAPEQNARDKKVTVEELLGRAATRIVGKFEKQPQVEAAIRQTIGETYLSLGNFPAAQPHLERALQIRQQVLGEEHPETIDSMSNLAELFRVQGQLAKAEPLYFKVLELSRRVLGEEHPDTLADMNNLAAAYTAQRQYANAEPLFTKSLEIMRRNLGEDDPRSLNVARNLAKLYHDQGEFGKAEPLSVKTLELTRRVQGEEHPHTLISMNNLGALYKDQGHFAKAEPLFLKAMEIRRRVLDEEHPLTLVSLNNLASLYYDMGQFAKAEPIFIKALEALRRIEGEEHPHTLTTKDSLAKLYWAQRQFAKAEPLHREELERSRKSHGKTSPWAVGALANLSLDLLKQHKYGEAEPHLRECLTMREQREPDDWKTFNTKSMLGGSLLGQKKYADAEPLLLAGYEGMKLRKDKIPAKSKVRLDETLERIVQLYEATNQLEKARLWAEKRKSAGVPDN